MSRKRKTRDAIPRNARDRAAQRDALAALNLMRKERLSASLAARAEGVSVRTIRKYVGSALRKRGKDYVARPSDHIVRALTTLDARGKRPTIVRSFKAASLIGRYWNAIDDALKGKPSALKEFRGRKIPYNNRKFLTNLKTLHRLVDADLLDNLKDIYWHGRRR